jgi:hypothetical protein
VDGQKNTKIILVLVFAGICRPNPGSVVAGQNKIPKLAKNRRSEGFWFLFSPTEGERFGQLSPEHRAYTISPQMVLILSSSR